MARNDTRQHHKKFGCWGRGLDLSTDVFASHRSNRWLPRCVVGMRLSLDHRVRISLNTHKCSDGFLHHFQRITLRKPSTKYGAAMCFLTRCNSPTDPFSYRIGQQLLTPHARTHSTRRDWTLSSNLPPPPPSGGPRPHPLVVCV